MTPALTSMAAQPETAFAEASGLSLDGVDGLGFAVVAGQTLHLHGTGGGAVLRALVGLELPRAGAVRLFGEDPAALSRRGAATLLARVGWLPRQGPLLANLTLRENLLLPLEYRGLGGASARCAAALARFGLAEAPDLRPERVALPVLRRVALARAVLLDPPLLLLEDPLDDLDDGSAAALAAALATWAREPGHALLVTSPDPRLAVALGASCVSIPVTRP